MAMYIQGGEAVKISGKCQWDHCDQPATQVAYGRRRREIGVYCEAHADRVIDQDMPEYTVSCPNCGCGFGVN